MSNSLISKVKLFVPQLWNQTVRHRGKYNVKMPHPRHEIARHLEELTRPVIIKELADPIETCLDQKSKIAKKLKFSTKDAVDFEKFLSNYALDLINKNAVMLICHKHDCSGEIFRRSKIEFKKNETTIWNFNTTIMKLLIENNPKYENLYPIVSTGLGKNYYLFCDEKNLQKNLNLLRKMPHLVLLGGMIQERLYTRNGIQNYIKMPSIDDLRGQLVASLNLQLASIGNTLTKPISNLSQSLSQHSKPSEISASEQAQHN